MVRQTKSFKNPLSQIPPEYRLWASAGILVALLVALPITLIGFLTGTFELRKRAVTGEPTSTPFLTPTATPSATPTATPSATPTPVGQGGVEGYVFLDANLNYQEDFGEHRLAGIQVQLYLEEGGTYTQQWNTLTFSGGIYSFSELFPGKYHLTLGTPDSTVVGGNQDFTITGDETIAGAIFGVWPSDISPTPTTQTLQFMLKFEGVTSRPSDDTDKQVQIYATSYDGGAPIGSADSKETITLSVDDSGIYHGEITLTSAFGYFGFHYRLRVKGPKHLQAVFPDVVFREGVELDLTGQTLRPGDLNLDSQVDRSDLQLIDERMFSVDPADVALADVNFDGRVDIIDRTLVLNTLSVYYDPD